MTRLLSLARLFLLLALNRLRHAARRLFRYLARMPGPLAVVVACALAGCAEMRAAEAPLLAIGEALCEAFLPRAMPTGASLVCKGFESLADAAVGHATAEPEPHPSSSPFGGGGAREPEKRTPRALTDPQGNPFAVVHLTAWEGRRAQEYVKARWVAAMPVTGGGR